VIRKGFIQLGKKKLGKVCWIYVNIKNWQKKRPAKRSRFSVSFRGISRLSSAFIFLRWFKPARICIQVTSSHTGEKFESISKFFKNRKLISRITTHRQSYLNKIVGLNKRSVTWNNSLLKNLRMDSSPSLLFRLVSYK